VRMYLQASDTCKQGNDSLRAGKRGAAGRSVTRDLELNTSNHSRRHAIEIDVGAASYIAYLREGCYIG
jgi:hypothetical protein